MCSTSCYAGSREVNDCSYNNLNYNIDSSLIVSYVTKITPDQKGNALLIFKSDVMSSVLDIISS